MPLEDTQRNITRFGAFGTSQRPWVPYPGAKRKITYAGALPAANQYLHLSSLPKTGDLAASGLIVIGPLDPANNYLIRPWITGAEGKIASWRFFGMTDGSYDGATEYFGDFLFDLTAEGGQGVGLASGSKHLPDGVRFCDVLTISNDHTLDPQVRKVHDQAECAGSVLLDGLGLPYILAYGTCTALGTAPTGCGLQVRIL